jgi:hypothetical protein
MTSFLEWPFRPLELQDHVELEPFLAAHPQKLADYTFAMLASWRPAFDYAWAHPEPETVLVSCTLEGGVERHLLQPIGQFSLKVLQQLAQAAAALPYALRILSVSEPFLSAHPILGDFFTIHPVREGDNYIYRAKDLATLEGRDYIKKRNLISQASRMSPWTTEPVGPDNVEACLDVVAHIEHDEPRHLRKLLEQEIAALKFTLAHFAELRQRGCLVRVEGRPVAFAIYETLGPDTAVVHFERALRDYKGFYQVINKETAKAIVEEGLSLINREEDIGDAGLRKAKLSYHPIRLEPCFWLELRR